MNYSSNIPAIVIVCMCVGIFLVAANAGVWGEEARMTGGHPTVIKMATTYTPCYLSRDSTRIAAFGRFRLGEKIKRLSGKCVPAVDDGKRSFFVEYEMEDSEYRGFRKAKLFFDKERQRLYKIVAEQTFSFGSFARDRKATINGVIEDCANGYGLSLARTVAEDNRIVYEGSDNVISVTLEMRKQADGHKRLLFVLVNKKTQSGEGQLSNSEDTADCVEVQI